MTLLLALGLAACGRAAPGYSSAAADAVATYRWAGLPVRKAAPGSVDLTLYSDNWAVVNDRRRLALDAGTQVVSFAGVAAHLDRPSALLDLPALVTATRFRDDLGDRSRMMARLDGATVDVFLPQATQSVPATLIQTASGPLYRIGGKLYSVPADRVVFPASVDIATEPELEWIVKADARWSGLATATYAAKGIGWSSSYTLQTDARQSSGTWQQWAELSNHSGAPFHQARVTLVAGQVRRAGRIGFLGAVPRAEAAGAISAPMPPLESYASRYEFRLPGPVTLEDETTQRVLLRRVADVPIARTYRFEQYVPLASLPTPTEPTKAEIRLTLPHDRESALHEPLPGGLVTVLTPDSQGVEGIAGEPAIVDTPVGQKVRLDLGPAFDVTLSRQQTRYEVKPKGHTLAYDLVLKNGQDASAPVVIVEHLPGDSSVVSASAPYDRPAPSDLRFKLNLPPQGAASVSFEVFVKQEQPGPRF